MNSTLDARDGEDNPGEETTGSYGYNIGVSCAILVILVVFTYSYYIYSRIRANANNHNNPPTSGGNSSHTNSSTTSTGYNSVSIPQGIDEATLNTYPKLLYSKAKSHEGDCTVSGCSICLQEYKDTDMIRLLPECGHIFHLRCIDPWLRLHPTCPICRNSPTPTPLDTPFVEVVPLAAR